MEQNVFTLVNENGEEVKYIGLNVIENPENGQKYLIYTEAENTKEITGKQIDLYACLYNKENGRIVLDPLSTEKEKTLIKTFIDENTKIA